MGILSFIYPTKRSDRWKLHNRGGWLETYRNGIIGDELLIIRMKGCLGSTIARPHKVITNQASFKSEAKPRYDEN